MRPNRYFADISTYQPHFDARAYRDDGHILIAVKASEGVNWVDPYHRGHSLQAGLNHIAVVHYHFARPDLGTNPDDEAAHFLHVTNGLRGPRDYLVLDLERGTPQGWQHDPAWSRQFDHHIITNTRYRTILYASRSVLQQSDQWLENDLRRVWDAAYSNEPDYAPSGYRVAFRQYTDGVVGPEPHIFMGVGQCDGDYMSRDIYNQLTGYRC